MIPIISKINNELLIVRLGGVLDTEMVNMIAIELNSIEAAGTYPKRIAFVDETLVIAIKSDNVVSYKMQRLEPKIVTKTAFCVFTDLQFGIARMFQSLLENDKHLIKIFKDKKTAAQWLDIDPELLQDKPA